LFAFIEYFSLHPTYRNITSYQLQVSTQEAKVGPIHYLFTKNFIPSQPETRVFKDLELPEEEIAGEDLESTRRARNLYIKPRIRPLYSLQVECLIVISRALHLYRGPTALTYNFQDTEDKDSYWEFTLPSTVPRPIGFNLREYTWLELARYIKPRLQNWIKSGGFHLYNKEKGWSGTESQAEPFYIDLWKIIDKEEVRILDWRFLKKEETSLDWYIETFRNVSQQKANKTSGQKRKRSSNA
jgi:hypothetical protein